jgi:hypothetical protein
MIVKFVKTEHIIKMVYVLKSKSRIVNNLLMENVNNVLMGTLFIKMNTKRQHGAFLFQMKIVKMQ